MNFIDGKMIVSKKRYLKDLAKSENDLFEITRERDRFKFLLEILAKNVKAWENQKIGNTKLCKITKSITEQI